MKKALLLSVILSSLTSILAVDPNQKTAAEITTAQQTKKNAEIRYVDPYKIIPKLEQWNDERARIQKDLDARSRQIEDLKVAYSTKANELQTKGNLLSEAGKNNAIKELSRLETDIKFEQQSFQETAERVSQEAQVVIFREIETVAKEYAQANGIDMIFAGGAIYVNEKYDISDTIANMMNKKYLAQKAKTATKPAAK